MVPQNIPDFDSQWDYSDPEKTEAKFREILEQIPEDNPAGLELLTQIARAQGLQREFNEAHKTLDKVEKQLGKGTSRTRIRYLLERGRAWNSSGRADEARPLFERAEEMATQAAEDFYAVDAVHMLAIVSPPSQALDLNLRAIGMAESSGNREPTTGLVLYITMRAGHCTTCVSMNRRWKCSGKGKHFKGRKDASTRHASPNGPSRGLCDP